MHAKHAGHGYDAMETDATEVEAVIQNRASYSIEECGV